MKIFQNISIFASKSDMPNDYFKFKQFTIFQSHCAMKVGTDGTLLGAWAHGGAKILDIGTGTGLIALMMAQRFPQAEITGIDIDEHACLQAIENVSASPFQAIIRQCDLKDMNGLFDCIVSNPPYFEKALTCPDDKRTLARHTTSLSYHKLMNNAWRLLSDEGELSVVIPADCKERLESEALLAGFFKTRECAVKTTPKKLPRRFLLAFRKHSTENMEKTEGIIETEPNVRSQWYQELTKDFYL